MTSESIHLFPSMPDNVTAFSTTRHGGCGEGVYGTFNCTPYTGDEPTIVRAHQEQLCQWLGIPTERLIIPYQTHSCRVLVADDTFTHLSADAKHALLQEKDALVTDLHGLCLCVSTADCIPILLYDCRHKAIAAIHAGWRGTIADIVTHTFETMHNRYSTEGTDVYAVIGPGISLDAFEVGNEVYETFHEAGFAMRNISRWHDEKEKYHLDLPAANRIQMESCGIPSEQIYSSNICTYAQHREFFSARRLGIKSGRILSGILLHNNPWQRF